MEDSKEDDLDRNTQELSQKKKGVTYLTFEKPDNIWKLVHTGICLIWRSNRYRTQIENSARSPGYINWSSKVKITWGQSCIVMPWRCVIQLAMPAEIIESTHATDSLKHIYSMITWRERDGEGGREECESILKCKLEFMN